MRETAVRLREPGDPPIETWTEFLQLCTEMVDDEVPYLFAVVQERGQREDGWIAGWGLAFGDHVDVVGLDDGAWVRLGSLAQAERLFDDDAAEITGLLVWSANDRDAMG